MAQRFLQRKTVVNPLYNEIKKEWGHIAQYKTPRNMEIELAFYKKMLSIFQVGEFYFFTFDPGNSKIENTSASIKKVLGYNPSVFDIDFMMSIMHPDDFPHFIEFEKKVVEFKSNLAPEKVTKYKSQYNYRVRRSDGKYIHILQQSVSILTDENGAALRNLIVHTDISSLNPDTNMNLSFVGLEGEPSYYNVLNNRRLNPAESFLSPREKEILRLLAENKSSSEIAKKLFISPETVSTHRKNIHRKTGTRTVLELVMKSIQKGWLGKNPLLFVFYFLEFLG